MEKAIDGLVEVLNNKVNEELRRGFTFLRWNGDMVEKQNLL